MFLRAIAPTAPATYGKDYLFCGLLRLTRARWHGTMEALDLRGPACIAHSWERPMPSTHMEFCMSSPTLVAPKRPERGLRYAVMGGLGVTLVTVLIGGLLFAWLLLATRGPTSTELLPADTQLYAALAPNLGEVLDARQLRQALQRELGVGNPDAAAPAIQRLLAVDYDEHLITWIGSDLAVAVRDADPAALTGDDAGAALLRSADVRILLASRNDPQAEAFIEAHLAAREAIGERFVRSEVDGATIYAQEDAPPSPIVAFALIDHYVVFANRAGVLEAMAASEAGNTSALASVPAFQTFREQLTPRVSGAIYTDGSQAAEAVRAALRQLMADLSGE